MKDITQVFGNYAKENLTKIKQENTVRAVEKLGFNVQKEILNSIFQKYDAAGIGSIYYIYRYVKVRQIRWSIWHI